MSKLEKLRNELENRRNVIAEAEKTQNLHLSPTTEAFWSNTLNLKYTPRVNADFSAWKP
jgi:hypothetical protein